MANPAVLKLREAWEKAIGKDRPKDALAALEGLERLEPQEPQWPHRKGDVLRRLGKVADAETAFVHAVQLYQSRGFLTRAAALAKAVVEANPARAALLAELDPSAAKKLRDDNRPANASSPLNPRMPPPPRMPTGTFAAVVPPRSSTGGMAAVQPPRSLTGTMAAVQPPRSPTGTFAAVAPPPFERPWEKAAVAIPPTPRSDPALPVPPIRRDEPAVAIPPIPRDEPAAVVMRAKPAPIPREEPEAPPPPPPPPPTPVVADAGYDNDDDDDDDDDDSAGDRPTLIVGIRANRVSVIAAAMGLEQAKDAADDEVRFDNVPDVFAIDVDVSELETQSTPDESSTPDLEVTGFPDEEAPTAVRLALMSGASLFVDCPKAVMADLVAAAELLDLPHGAHVYRSNDRANGLYVLVEGKVHLVPTGSGRRLVVAEGSVFGEDCLLQSAVRNADARVNGRLLALHIPKDALDRILKRHAALGDVLFDVLVRRLVTIALQTLSLFSAFDVPTRKDLARLFEVRRAAPGVVLKQQGKRSDGLYLALAGEFEVEEDGKKTLLPLGTMFGHSSLLSDEPEKRTIRVLKESVVLRLSASRFVSFAARFPAALAHLTDLAKQPHAY